VLTAQRRDLAIVAMTGATQGMTMRGKTWEKPIVTDVKNAPAHRKKTIPLVHPADRRRYSMPAQTIS
jgi:hypothetical protein